MSLPLTFTREAQDEMDDTYAWYDQQRKGLGEEFLAAVRGVLERIQENPELFRQVYGNVRHGSIHRFPYSICYRVQGDRIEVLAVFHGFRDPSRWKQRV